MSAIFFSFFVFELSSFFQRKCWWFAHSDFILVSQKNKCTCQKSETPFFSRTCQEANVMFTVLFRLFLEGLESNSHRHMLWQTRLNYALSYHFEIFKEMSHNLELLSFQKMCGLSGFIREARALQRSARGRSWRADWYFELLSLLEPTALFNWAS